MTSLIFLVSRIKGKSEIYEFEIELDVNTDIYSIEQKQYYMIALASSLKGEMGDDKGK